ncbi:hypothetical protein E2C01_038461 [Portunus trituberculatus]|uniref:Uncharacterized protein n=1 Tax=Portunus trituberculatus TaxID=210409 RepID=A0A5B7FE80_PORTR|nr:hypothetical protein [Portunus trituberculatus]
MPPRWLTRVRSGEPTGRRVSVVQITSQRVLSATNHHCLSMHAIKRHYMLHCMPPHQAACHHHDPLYHLSPAVVCLSSLSTPRGTAIPPPQFGHATRHRRSSGVTEPPRRETNKEVMQDTFRKQFVRCFLDYQYPIHACPTEAREFEDL